MSINAASAVINANLPSTQAVFYDSLAVDALYANLAFQTLTTKRRLPKKNGKTIQLFGYDLAPFTSGVKAGNAPATATEGTVGTGIVPTQSKVQAVLGQFVDYVTVSDFALDVAIDNPLENLSELLGYRGAMVADTLVQMELDAAIALDASAGVTPLADGTYMTSNVLRSAVQSLEGKDAKRFEDGLYRGVIHPFVLGDALNDGSNNGIVDVLKRSSEGQKAIASGFEAGEDRQSIEIFGVRWVTSTNVPLTTGVPTAGKSAFSTYIAAKDAVFSIGLGAGEEKDSRNFKTRITQFAPSAGDPGNVIGGAVSYNFKNVVAPRPGSVMTFRRLQSESAIS